MSSLNEQLKQACKTGNFSEMERLVAQGADVNNLDDGYTPMVWAAVDGKTESVRWLLDHGAEADLRSAKAWTPLMSAVSGGHAAIVQLLLDHGAAPALANGDGKNAIHLAREKGNAGIVNLLTRTPDEVVFSDTVYDRVVQEVYSFKRRERFTFVRKSENGDVEAVQRESFTDLADKSGLRKAFEEHQKRGGKLSEEDVFQDMIPKRKLLPRPGGM